MMKSVYILAALQLLLVSAEPECTENGDKLLEEGNAAFTGRFLYEALKINPNKNMIMSPFSVFIPLGQIGLHAEGNTKDQILQALNLPNKSDIKCVFPGLVSSLRAEKNVTLNFASKIYSTDLYPLSDKFLENTKNVFDAEAETLDFSNRQAAADTINKWVEDQTNNRIKDIASPDMFNEDTRLVLANAIYFLGTWIKRFETRNTIDRDFYINSDKKVKLPTMYQENNYRYGENSDLDCKILEMPYEGGNFSFVVFLPNKIDGLFNLVENLQTSSAFYGAYDSTRYEKVKVYIPKMKTESEFDLAEILEKIGITDVFDPRKSNLTEVLKEYEPLFVSKAVQKAFCEMDEKGTEAAAANIIVGGPMHPAPPSPSRVFNADHPFAFHILYKRHILFGGTFVTK